MELNLPVLNQLSQCKNLLIAGMGGGFDVFCGLPIYFELTRRGQRVHLANFSFSDIENTQHGTRLTSTLVGIADAPGWIYPYFPEFYLARWFKEQQAQDVTVWCFQKTGTTPLLKNYRALVEHLEIDGILLIDGGVDSLMRGNEAGMGTVVEDATSLFVVNELTEIPLRMLACIGFGAEQDVAYGHVLENIAAITKSGGFWGSCALVPQMESYQAYESAVLFVQSQPVHDPSVINSSMISSVRGEFGNYHLTPKTEGSRLWISPLMSLYWFFDLEIVANRNLFLPNLANTLSFRDALRKTLEATSKTAKRPVGEIRL